MPCIKSGNTILCVNNEVDKEQFAGIDFRTKVAHEFLVYMQVKLNKGFTCFWASDTMKRAHAIHRLYDAGIIEPIEDDRPYPWKTHKLKRKVERYEEMARNCCG